MRDPLIHSLFMYCTHHSLCLVFKSIFCISYSVVDTVKYFNDTYYIPPCGTLVFRYTLREIAVKILSVCQWVYYAYPNYLRLS